MFPRAGHDNFFIEGPADGPNYPKGGRTKRGPYTHAAQIRDLIRYGGGTAEKKEVSADRSKLGLS